MLAEGDPIARALLAEYDNLPMSSLKLVPAEIEALLVYIGEESDRLRR